MKTSVLIPRILIILVALILISGVLFLTGHLRLNYPSISEYPVNGIDISHHQGEIDWAILRNESIDFIFMKATEGGDFVDPRFKQNWAKAKVINVKTGAYHFYRFCKNGLEQAANIKRVVPKDSSSLPIVLDLEFDGNCASNKSKNQLIAEIESCLFELQTYYGSVPILYVTNDFYAKYVNANNFKQNPIWIRDIISSPNLSDLRKWTFWQYSNCGRVRGITGCVDLNVFNGSKEELLNLK